MPASSVISSLSDIRLAAEFFGSTGSFLSRRCVGLRHFVHLRATAVLIWLTPWLCSTEAVAISATI